MGMTQLNGRGPYWPDITHFLVGLQFNTSAIIDATGEKFAMLGRVYFNERASTKAIRKVGFCFGSVTKAGGSGLTVSLQDAAAGTGPPLQPDETQDQTVAIANGDANFASNTWYQTGNLSADRTVNFGDLLAIVVEFDGSGRLGADSVAINNLAGSSGGGIFGHQGLCVLKTGGTFALNAGIPVCVLEFSDGTFGTLLGSVPASAVGSTNYKSDSTPDEVAMRFTVPFNCKTDGGVVAIQIAANTSDFDIVLYQGTSALATVSIDANQVRSTNNDFVHFLFSSEIALTPSTEYFLAVKPTQATSNVRVQFFDFASASYMQPMPMGTAGQYATRTDAGAWSTTTTRRMLAGVRISSIGSSSPRHPGMNGGCNA